MLQEFEDGRGAHTEDSSIFMLPVELLLAYCFLLLCSCVLHLPRYDLQLLSSTTMTTSFALYYGHRPHGIFASSCIDIKNEKILIWKPTIRVVY